MQHLIHGEVQDEKRLIIKKQVNLATKHARTNITTNADRLIMHIKTRFKLLNYTTQQISVVIAAHMIPNIKVTVNQ